MAAAPRDVVGLFIGVPSKRVGAPREFGVNGLSIVLHCEADQATGAAASASSRILPSTSNVLRPLERAIVDPPIAESSSKRFR
jgi:hypothetical protein